MANIAEIDRTRLILAPEANFPTQNFEVDQAQNGFVVCRSKILQGESQPFLCSTDGSYQLARAAAGFLIASKDQQSTVLSETKRLIIPTDEQIMELVKAPEQEPSRRSSAELARALHNPYLF